MVAGRNARRATRIALAAAATMELMAGQVVLASNRPKADLPEGFGAGTTGGRHGEVVRVSTAKDLAYQLCRTFKGVTCADNAARVIELATTIDFTGSEGEASGTGCRPGNVCTSPYKTESLVLLGPKDTHCDGKALTEITFDKAGKDPLVVGSNKTILGVGRSAGLKGKGLRLDGVSNVVIRNLTFSDINQGIVFAGDAITLTKADHVWIDHNRFHNIGRQMITGGFGATTNITISWNDFDGSNVYSPFCNGEHYWNLLLLGNPQSITIANNWFHDVSGRAPHVDSASATIHLVNNYFRNEHLQQSGGFFHALDAGNPGVKVLVEGNYFDNIESPITKTGTGSIFGVLGMPDRKEQAQCKKSMGRPCMGNVATPMPKVNRFVQDMSVMKNFSVVPKSSVVAPYLTDDVPATVRANAGPGHL